MVFWYRSHFNIHDHETFQSVFERTLRRAHAGREVKTE